MKTISVIFHPLLIATHLSGLLLLIAPELLPRIQPGVYFQFLLIIFLITAVMPAVSLFLLKTFKYISDIELENRGERFTPFLFILIYYGIASYLFMVKLEMEALFNTMMISVTILIFILLLITTRFKISIHAAAIWSAAGYLTAINILYGVQLSWVFYSVLLAAGLTSTSRLYLGYHTSKEVWSGAFLGFCYGILALLLFA